MAKMQKMDPKQVPQVIALGVLSVGVFGYALFTFSGSAPKPAEPAKKDAAASGAAAESATGTAATSAAGTKMALSVAETGTDSKSSTSGAPEIALPGQYNPDPFKSAVKPEETKPVEVTPKPAPVAPKVKQVAPPLPDARGSFPLAPPASAGSTAPLVPLGPERPEVKVTGTSVVDGMNLAILEVGPEHRVVQVGDIVSKGYRVKKIQLQGVVFVKDKDHFFQGVGAKTETAKADNTLGKSSQF